jgi:hypothetical protein
MEKETQSTSIQNQLNERSSSAQDLVRGRGGAPAGVLGLLQTLGVTGLAVRVGRLGVAETVALDDV